MRVIIPLAGPDFILPDGTLKAQIDYHGKPLLRHIVDSRPWKNSSTHISFVLFDCHSTRVFASECLAEWYPKSTITFLSNYTRGAALSALAGIVMGQDHSEPITVDLADILYQSTLDPVARLAESRNIGGIALTFFSSNPAYSYLRLNSKGHVIEAAEKRVISEYASAGTYVFRNTSIYLRALAHSLENEAAYAFSGLFYICPLFNGVLHQGIDVVVEPVANVFDNKVKY